MLDRPGPSGYHPFLPVCIDFMRQGRLERLVRQEANPRGCPGDQRRRRPPGRRPRAGRGTVRQSARPGPGRRARRSPCGQPTRSALGGRPGREVERLALAALEPGQRPGRDRADPRADRRGARRPLGARQVPGRHHAVLHQPDGPARSQRPDPPAGHPARPGAAGLHGDDGGQPRRGSPLPGAGPRPSVSRSRAHARHDPVRELLPLLHAEAGSSATPPRTSTARTTRPSSSTCATRPRSGTCSSAAGTG